MEENVPKKKRGCGGCLVFIVFVFFAIRILTSFRSTDKSSYVEFKTLDMAELNYINKIYTIKNSDYNSEVIFTQYNWNYITSNLKKRSLNLNIEVSKNEVDSAMEILNSMLDLTLGDLNISADFDTEKELYHKQYWTGMYKYMLKHTGSQIEFISTNLKKIAINERLNRNDLLTLCITMVQNIEYKIPEGTLGIIPPINSIANEFGDCDTISILLYAILEDLGFDTILYLSKMYAHAMLGINTNATGHHKILNGKPYYFLEVTNTGWGLGQISAEMQDLNLWEPIDL